MIPVLSREQMRSFDAFAIEKCKISSLLLMENAGRGAADLLLQRSGAAGAPERYVVLAGPGNNGGDGFVVARRLAVHRQPVQVILASQVARLKHDARHQCNAFAGIGGQVLELSTGDGESRLRKALSEATTVVDALFGTGLDRPVVDWFERIIQNVNSCPARVVALDVPSGLDANTGQPLGAAVRADWTLTFGHLKPGLLTTKGLEHAGEVDIVDIGVPAELYRKVGHCAEVFDSDDARRLFFPRPSHIHKSKAGRVMVLAGSRGKTGAALLVARGALRTGAGLVTLLGLPEVANSLDQRVFEAMTSVIDDKNPEVSVLSQLEAADALAIGPGLGLAEQVGELTRSVALKWEGRIVLDADGLTHFAGRLSELQSARGEVVLTPHPGEAARLLGMTPKQVEADRFGAVKKLADDSGCSVLLKGPRSLCAATGRVPRVNRSGHAALATAGSGDVLSGIVAALSVDHEVFDAASLGAFVHGCAGEAWAAENRADRGLLAHEIADKVPGVIAALAKS